MSAKNVWLMIAGLLTGLALIYMPGPWGAKLALWIGIGLMSNQIAKK